MHFVVITVVHLNDEADVVGSDGSVEDAGD